MKKSGRKLGTWKKFLKSFINTNYFILTYIFYFQPLSFSDNLKYIAISNTYEVYFMYVIYKLYIE